MEERGKKLLNFDFRMDIEGVCIQVVQFVPEAKPSFRDS